MFTEDITRICSSMNYLNEQKLSTFKIVYQNYLLYFHLLYTFLIYLYITFCSGHPKRRRTVSFSEYVDLASFRNNDTITAMHNSLKSRRRNKRRKDQRKVNREGCKSTTYSMRY